MGKFVDLTGQKFGRLTVIERAENKGKKVAWLCKCECGNDKVIIGGDLKNGKTVSCGCLKSEKMKQLNEEQWQDEDFKKIQSEKMKDKWKDEDFKKMQSEKTKERVKEQWQDEDFKKMQSEKMKDKWKDEDFKKMQSEKSSERMKDKWKDEEYRKMQSEKSRERMKEQWQDEEMKWKMGYKGGITPISAHLRTLNRQWYEDCKKQANYTCQLTGKRGNGNLHTHHLKAFSTIVIEVHDLHNIEVKQQVKDYTQEELKLLEEYVGSWHKDNSNAVVLSEDVHKLFHSLYGCGENTPEQYIEFKERYLAGEFKEILK